MREFTKNDWLCYEGCESQIPMIGEVKVNFNGKIYEGEVVVDGSHVEIYTYHNGSEDALWYQITFPSYLFAINAAMQSIENKTLSDAMLKEMGFKS